MNTSNNSLPNAERLSAEVVSAIVNYQPSELDPLLVATFLDPIRNLVAQVPPRSVDDAQQMLSAATRFVRETAPDVTLSVIEVFDRAVITRWEHASLAAGNSFDCVRLYASWLHRLRRVSVGCIGRRPRGNEVQVSVLTYTTTDIAAALLKLDDDARGAFVALVGAGLRPERFGNGVFVRDLNRVWAVTEAGQRHCVVQPVVELLELTWTGAVGSWADLRGAASRSGVHLEFQRCLDTFAALVACYEPACDALTSFGLSRTSLDRVIKGILVAVDASAPRRLAASGFGAVAVTMNSSIRDRRQGANMARPSRKSIRELATSYAAGGVVKLSADHTARVDQYRPQGVGVEVWDALSDTHREAMHRCGELSESGFSQTMSIVSSMLVWRHSRSLGVDLASSFTRNSIDLFCEHGLDGNEPSTRNTYRSRLNPIAEALDPNAIARPVYSTRGHQPIKPCYTATEERSIRRAVTSHPSGVTGRKLAAVVSLAAGAGLDTMDMRFLERRHIVIKSNAITINVPGSRPRLTVLRSVYDDMLKAGLDGLSDKQMVFGVKKNRRNVLGSVFSDAVLFDDTPQIEVSRLRATWLAAHMQAAVPIQIILNAAGLKSARALVDLLPYLPDTNSDTTTTVLRGAAS